MPTFLVHKAKHDCSCCAKNLAHTLWRPLTKKITGTKYHHKLMLCSSCHVPRRVLGGTKKVEQGTIRVGGERILVITRALIATTVTQRATSCHYRWYLFLFRWIIQSSIHLRCCRFVNTQRAISCRHLSWLLPVPLLWHLPRPFLGRGMMNKIWVCGDIVCLIFHL